MRVVVHQGFYCTGPTGKNDFYLLATSYMNHHIITSEKTRALAIFSLLLRVNE